LSELEDIFRRIGFEKAVEGRVLTQRWYVAQLIADNYAEFARSVAIAILDNLRSLFLATARQLLSTGRVVDASVWLQRSIEACSKAKSQLVALESFYARLKEHHVTERPWHEWDGSLLLQTSEIRKEVILLVSDCVPTLIGATGNQDLPDVVGHSRLWIADELLSIMESKAVGSMREFAKLFTAYFNATQAVIQQMFGIARQPGKSRYSRAAMDAMLDLLEMSGIALLFSELDGTPFGKVIRRAWDHYFDQHQGDKSGIVKAWLSPLESPMALPAISSSSTQRFYWERRLVEALTVRGALTAEGYYGSGNPPNPHPSPVIRALHVHMGHLLDPPSEFFAAIYLAPLAGANNVALPRAVEDCRKNIQRRTGEKSGE
jgi:hypothetical protein